MQYKVTDFYSPPHDRGIAWNDPKLMIPWPVAAEAVGISARDSDLPCLADATRSFRVPLMTVIVTGGAGFIGSALVRALVADGERVITIDKLTYAGNLDNLAAVLERPNHVFVRADICDRAAMAARLRRAPSPRRVSPRRREPCRSFDRHSAAHSSKPMSSARRRCSKPPLTIGAASTLRAAPTFRFLQVSTDEVYGELGPTGMFRRRQPLSAELALFGQQGRRPTISPARGTALMACRCWSRTARTITAPISFPKS